MPYDYQETRKELFTDEGQRIFLAVRDHAKRLLEQAGAARAQEMWTSPSIPCGSTWLYMACIDRMVELGEISEVMQGNTFGQYRVFVAKE